MSSGNTPPFPAYDGDEPYVFICYSHANRAEVYAELVRLRDAGIHIWYDEGIAPGQEWTEDLANAIRDCDRFLYFVSPASVATRNCRDEVQFALKHRKPLLAVHLEDTALPGGLDLAIGSTQGILKYRLAPGDYERKLFAGLRNDVASHATQRASPAARFPSKSISPRARRLRLGGVAVAAAVALIAHRLFALPTTPTIGEYTPLTQSRVLFSPFPSPQRLATDGEWIYFNEWRSGEFEPRRVSTSGGESAPVAIPAQLPQLIAGTSPNRSELLLGSPGDSPWWLWAREGTSPRRLGSLSGHDLSWSADGTRLVNLVGNDVVVAQADGTNPKVIHTARAPVWGQLSPDGRRIRFTDGDGDQIWQIAAEGSDPHPLLPAGNGFEHTCCGSWTPDGRHYVFQGTRDNQHHLWVIDETQGLFGGAVGKRSSEPHQLTTGAMHFIRPLIASDGKRLYAVGWHLRGELVRHDAATGQFVPHYGSRSAEWLVYSHDGKRAAYVSYPEGDLWASDADGTQAVQLTRHPMRPVNPTWSPTGDAIAFSATTSRLGSRLYLVPADGSAPPRRITHNDRDEQTPTWSVDGRRLAFSTPDGLHLIDADGGNDSELVGAEKYHSPSWSPDGSELTALAGDPTRIVRYRFNTSRWEDLAQTPDAIRQIWSPDGASVLYVTRDPVSDVYRIQVAEGRVERVLSLRTERWVWGAAGIWFGLTPDGSILYLRDQSVHHIYALDWDA